MRPLLLMVLLFPVVALADEPPLTDWAARHPAASDALGAWVQTHPQAAETIFKWSSLHPERARIFVTWLADAPGQSLDDFKRAHARWPAVRLVLTQDPEAIDAFVAWGHTHPMAVRALAAQRRGLAWLGFHVYRELWDTPAAPDDVPSQAP